MFVGLAMKRKFGDDGSVPIGDAFGELFVFAGVEFEESGAENGNGATVGVEGGKVGLGVDPTG